MARAPMAMAAAAPGGAAGGMMADPSAGGDPSAGAGGDSGGGVEIVCTVGKNPDGSYVIYAGDEPDEGGGGDMSEDDANAMGSAPGGAPPSGGMAGGSQGVPADSVGAATKAVMDVLNADKSTEGAPGNADDQLAAGFSSSQSPTPASGPAQKY